MDYIKKLFQALLDTLVPPGTIIMFGGTQVPDGYILIQNVKVYQDEFPRLYPILAACAELEKGNDSGRAWVKMVNPDGRVPQFTTSGSLVWQLLEASLPNIAGSMFFIAGAVSDQTSATGAFDYTGRTGTKAGAVWFDSGASNEDKIEFNSSSDNSIYSEGGTVQQAALQALVCIKF